MSKELNNDTIKEFLEDCLASDDAITDFGYLLIPSDPRLNDEALSYIKDRFHDFVNP